MSRLVSAAEGLNVRRTFDGVRVVGHHGDWTWNAGIYHLVKTETGVFDDASDRNLTHWGLGAIGRHTLWAGAGFSLYYFGGETTPGRAVNYGYTALSYRF
jgi:alginate export protein